AVSAGSGSGTVSGAGMYDVETVVTLVATADPGSRFAGWSGDACSGVGPCTLTMTMDVTATATFVRQYTLTAVSGGAGSGTVSGAGVCGLGAVVTLVASADPGSRFAGWSGGCRGTGPCSFTLAADATVIATFTTIQPATIVTAPGAGMSVLVQSFRRDGSPADS